MTRLSGSAQRLAGNFLRKKQVLVLHIEKAEPKQGFVVEG